MFLGDELAEFSKTTILIVYMYFESILIRLPYTIRVGQFLLSSIW